MVFLRRLHGRFCTVVSPRRRYRAARYGLYASMFAAGILCFLLRLPFFTNLLGSAVALNGLFLIVGSVVSTVGYARKHPGLEVVGYPLLITAMGIFAIVVFATPHATSGTTLIGLVFTGMTFGLYGRSRDIRYEHKMVDRLTAGLDSRERTHGDS
jgi:hypothetical protein